MSNLLSAETSTGMPVWQAGNLALLLEECIAVVGDLSLAQRCALTRLAELDPETVASIAEVIEATRGTGYDDGMSSVWQCHCDRCTRHYLDQLRGAAAEDPENEMFAALCGAAAADAMIKPAAPSA